MNVLYFVFTYNLTLGNVSNECTLLILNLIVYGYAYLLQEEMQILIKEVNTNRLPRPTYCASCRVLIPTFPSLDVFVYALILSL